jgi:hypothetical protein
MELWARLPDGSGVSREAPAPFCERPEVKFLRPTHHRSHYVRDVTLCEDASRIRKNPGIFATIRSFAYNILRMNQSDSIAQDRYAAALRGLDFLLSLNFM